MPDGGASLLDRANICLSHTRLHLPHNHQTINTFGIGRIFLRILNTELRMLDGGELIIPRQEDKMRKQLLSSLSIRKESCGPACTFLGEMEEI